MVVLLITNGALSLHSKVVGTEEMESGTVNVRNRDATEKGKSEVISVEMVIAGMKRLQSERRNDNSLA